jgi:tetratricopeptide (TPR) repeat protein
MQKHSMYSASLVAMLMAMSAACTTAEKKPDVKPVVDKTASQKEAEELGVSPKAWESFQLGVAALAKEPSDREGARGHFEAALVAQPDFAEAHYNLAMIYEAQGQSDKARGHLEAAREADPNAPEYKVAMGRLYAETGDFEKATVLFEEVLARDAANPAARNNLALVALKKGDLEASKAHVIEILREDEKNVPALTTLALIYKAQKNYPLASYIFGKALDFSNNKNPDVFNHIGIMMLEQNNIPQAVIAFEKANEAGPKFLYSRLNLGAILIEYLDYQRADKQFEEAMALAPDNCVANLGRGATLFALEKHADAAARYEFYLDKCESDHVSSWERLAKLYEGKLANPDKAIEAYRKLISLTPDESKQNAYKAMIQFLESQKNAPKQPEQPPADGAPQAAPAEAAPAS